MPVLVCAADSVLQFPPANTDIMVPLFQRPFVINECAWPRTVLECVLHVNSLLSAAELYDTPSM